MSQAAALCISALALRTSGRYHPFKQQGLGKYVLQFLPVPSCQISIFAADCHLFLCAQQFFEQLSHKVTGIGQPSQKHTSKQVISWSALHHTAVYLGTQKQLTEESPLKRVTITGVGLFKQHGFTMPNSDRTR